MGSDQMDKWLSFMRILKSHFSSKMIWAKQLNKQIKTQKYDDYTFSYM